VTRLAAAVCLATAVAAISLAAAPQSRTRPTQRPTPSTQPRIAGITREAIMLAGDRLRADRWIPANAIVEPTHELRRQADEQLLAQAVTEQSEVLRLAAARELGLLGTLENLPTLEYLAFADPAVQVRRSAIDAAVQLLFDQPEAALPFARAIELRLPAETNVAMVQAYWEALADLPLPIDMARRHEERLVNEIVQQGPLLSVTAPILAEHLWNRRGRPVEQDTVDNLREWFHLGVGSRDGRAILGTVLLGHSLTFLDALNASGDADDLVLQRARSFLSGAVRGRAVEMMNPFNPLHRQWLEEIARGTDLAIRDAAIRRLLANPESPLCDLYALDMGDIVRLEVIARLAKVGTERASGCGDWSAERELVALAETLGTAGAHGWRAPMTAMEAIAAARPTEAGAVARIAAVEHGEWLVRAAAARVSAIVKDRDLAVRLVTDKHPMVRVEALKAMAALKHPELIVAAEKALADRDYGLVYAAAQALQEYPEPLVAMPALLASFERLSVVNVDTSRQPRLALLTRVVEFLERIHQDRAAWAVKLQRFAEDMDPIVADAVAKVVSRYTETFVEARPRVRPALQPSDAQLAQMPPCVLIDIETGDDLQLNLSTSTPMAVARFLMLVRSGFYRNQTIPVSTWQVAFFGSPSPNEFVAAPRFIRDEPSGRSVRAGSVVMLGHGPDTLDGRLMVHAEDRRDRTRRDTVIGTISGVLPPAGAVIKDVIVPCPRPQPD
jgi:HEAT repeat protein